MDIRPSVFFVCILGGLVIVLAATPFLTSSKATLLQAAFIMAALAISFQVVFGLLGQLSLGHSALFGAGAYTYAATSLAGADLPVALLAAAIAGGILGVLASAVTARLGGAYFAVVTYALASVAALIVGATPSLGLTDGLMGIPSFSVPGFPRATVQVAVTACTCAFTLAAFYLLWRSRFGWILETVRNNPSLAAALGINVPLAMVVATAFSGVLAGGIGAIFAQNARFVSLDVFGLYYIVTPLAAVVIGGAHSLFGALLGTVVALVIPLELSIGPIANQIVSGALMTAFVVLLPQGLTGLISSRIRKRPHAIEPTALAWQEPHIEAGVREGGEEALAVKGVSVSYGANQAVRDLSLRIGRGEIVGLIGPNGAGKSSLVNALSGLVQAKSGRISVAGRDLTGTSPYRRVRFGLARTFQNTAVVETLTVYQSVALAFGKGRYRAVSAGETDAVNRALQACGLTSLAGTKVRDLSYMHRRLTAIAMALVPDPAVVCLDEATAGLTAEERGEIGRLVQALAKQHGTAFLVIEHDVEFVATVADRIVVMTEGALLTEGRPETVLRDPNVVAAYLGSAWNAPEAA